jgi:MFS family permease
MSPTLAAAAAPASTAEPDATPASWYGLSILIVVALYGVVDRQVFIVLAEQIKTSMALSDFQLGLLQGLGVSLFAAIVGYPIGWLADRYDRRVVLACCIVLWSLAVAACGLAPDFKLLFIASAMVGAGEAGITPIMFALIPELFRNEKRQFANSLNIVVGRLGTGAAIAFCGYLTQIAEWSRPFLPLAMQGMETWRLTFFWAALPAPLFVLLLITLPVQGNATATAPSAGRGSATQAGGRPGIGLGHFMRAHRVGLATLFLAVTVATMGLVAMVVWLPVVAMRQYGATPVQVGNALGTAVFVSSAVGLLFSVFGMRWLRPRVGPRLPVVAMAIASAASTPPLLMLPLASSVNGLFVLYCVHMTLLMIGLMTYPTSIQEVAPRHLCARMFAIVGVLGISLPSVVPSMVGLLSDALKDRPDGLLLASMVFSVGFLLLASGLFIWAARNYEATVRAAAEVS